jgi:branched-chain amino acid transport system ATP-binding protein
MTDQDILRTEGLTKEFKGFTAVDDVSLSVRRHSVHALIGPNGAGKTTVFNLLTHFLQPSRGRILFNGRNITGVKPARIARMGVIRSFQVSAVFPHLTALENVRVALQRKAGAIYQFWRSEASLDRFNDRANELLAQVDLQEFSGTLVADMPYGRKRALEIATTLALEPELMLLDEPTQGMGREDVKRITALIGEVATGRTVLMVEHNLGVVSELCDRITVLQRGAILTEGTYAEVSSDPRVKEAYMGTAE